MGLKTFFKNLNYLFKYNIKEIYKSIDSHAYFHSKDYINNFMEQILYESSSGEIKRPKIKTHTETIQKLIKSNCSLARFGDGEIQIIEGFSIPFQEYNEELAQKLKNILKSNNENLLVGINYEYYYPDISAMNDLVANFYRHDVPALRKKLNKYINYTKQYVTAGFTQLYMSFKEYDFENHYKNLKQIWDKKKILIVACENALKDIKYNIFDNAKEINYLYIPSKHAYSEYIYIYIQRLKLIPKIP